MSDLTSSILFTLRGFCYLALSFYVLRVLEILVLGVARKHGEPGQPEKLDAHGLREAMAVGYTGVAAYYVLHGTDAITSFTSVILSTSALVKFPASGSAFLSVCAGLICT